MTDDCQPAQPGDDAAGMTETNRVQCHQCQGSGEWREDVSDQPYQKQKKDREGLINRLFFTQS